MLVSCFVACSAEVSPEHKCQKHSLFQKVQQEKENLGSTLGRGASRLSPLF